MRDGQGRSGSALFAGYEERRHTDATGRTHTVYRRGDGPPIIVLHELFGISPPLMRFASEVVDRGFSVHLPSLVEGRGRRGTFAWKISTVTQLCVSAEFIKLATGRTSPIVGWLRSLAREIHDKTGGPVGAVGMCLTGGFALAMAVEPAVTASILAQPFLPVGIGRKRRRDLGLSNADLSRLKARTDLRIFGARFTGDVRAPRERFDRLDQEFGQRFVRNEIASGFCSATRLPPWAHSTLTMAVCTDPDHPAMPELSRVLGSALDFLETELRS